MSIFVYVLELKVCDTTRTTFVFRTDMS